VIFGMLPLCFKAVLEAGTSRQAEFRTPYDGIARYRRIIIYNNHGNVQYVVKSESLLGPKEVACGVFVGQEVR